MHHSIAHCTARRHQWNTIEYSTDLNAPSPARNRLDTEIGHGGGQRCARIPTAWSWRGWRRRTIDTALREPRPQPGDRHQHHADVSPPERDRNLAAEERESTPAIILGVHSIALNSLPIKGDKAGSRREVLLATRDT